MLLYTSINERKTRLFYWQITMLHVLWRTFTALTFLAVLSLLILLFFALHRNDWLVIIYRIQHFYDGKFGVCDGFVVNRVTICFRISRNHFYEIRLWLWSNRDCSVGWIRTVIEYERACSVFYDETDTNVNVIKVDAIYFQILNFCDIYD